MTSARAGAVPPAPASAATGTAFDMLKFRSMRLAEPEAAPHAAEPGDNVVRLRSDIAPGGVEGSDRRTWIGRIMRRTAIDELPQLFNVVAET